MRFEVSGNSADTAVWQVYSLSLSNATFEFSNGTCADVCPLGMAALYSPTGQSYCLTCGEAYGKPDQVYNHRLKYCYCPAGTYESGDRCPSCGVKDC